MPRKTPQAQIHILEVLKSGKQPLSAYEIAKYHRLKASKTGTSEWRNWVSNVSHHAKQLYANGEIKCFNKGRIKAYSL